MKMSEQNQHLNSQQVAAYEKRLAEQLSAAIAAMNLRKWSVEQALPFNSSSDNLIHAAQQIFDFVSAPANVSIKID
jgi:hypothetical protein